MEINSLENDTINRKELDSFLEKGLWKNIGKVKGYEIVAEESNVEIATGTDCYFYAVPDLLELLKINLLEDIFNSDFDEIDISQAREGDVVGYFNKSKWPAHVGVYKGNSMVESKFGSNGYVYKHPLKLVPTMYGNEIKFFRRK